MFFAFAEAGFRAEQSLFIVFVVTVLTIQQLEGDKGKTDLPGEVMKFMKALA